MHFIRYIRDKVIVYLQSFIHFDPVDWSFQTEGWLGYSTVLGGGGWLFRSGTASSFSAVFWAQLWLLWITAGGRCRLAAGCLASEGASMGGSPKSA